VPQVPCLHQPVRLVEPEWFAVLMSGKWRVWFIESFRFVSLFFCFVLFRHCLPGLFLVLMFFFFFLTPYWSQLQFCNNTNDVPLSYACPMIGAQRQDISQRPELYKGTVEFVTTGIIRFFSSFFFTCSFCHLRFFFSSFSTDLHVGYLFWLTQF
jgi:hypothetical protein